MILIDTCGWIEWLTEGALVNSFAPFMQDPANLLVPSVVQFELYKWVKREADENTAIETIALADGSLVVPLTTEIALMAADMAILHKLSLADSVVYASARKHGADLVTSDSHFEGLPGVTFFSNKVA